MSTYTPIATQTLGSAAASVTFSSIPQGYTDLILVINAGCSGASEQDCLIRVNGDTGSNYSATYLYGTGSSAASGRNSNQTESTAGYPIRPTLISTLILQFQNYSNTTTYKNWLGRANSANSMVYSHISLWRNTNAINTILLYPSNSVNFLAGSTFSLYGIQVGNAAQKAQGGNIVTSDGTYIYHAFTSSGSFIPNIGLTADVLVVAGGGGGSVYAGGGGGAGGLLPFTSQSLTATSYTVTVGAGGIGGQVTSGSLGVSGNDSQFGSLTLVKGGGYGGGAGFNINGTAGGSGGGAGGAGGTPASTTGGTATSGQGNAGGNSTDSTGSGTSGGGGGGAGSAGATPTTNTQIGADGGAGLNTWSSWLSATSLGVSGYLAGGGGSGGVPSYGNGGSGGGGRGSILYANAVSGVTNTGSGGGGVWYGGTGGNGGSGLVIVRYLA